MEACGGLASAGGSTVPILRPQVLDWRLAPTELSIEAENAGVTLLAPSLSAPLLTLRAGAPVLSLHGLTLTGGVVVDGGALHLSNCTMRDAAVPHRALHVLSGGEAEVEETLLVNNSGGAIVVGAGGRLRMLRGGMRGNAASRGGALLVSGGSATVADTRITNNEASEHGGAICAEGGEVTIGNRTLLRDNVAPPGGGASIWSEVALTYRLPAPLAHWVFVPGGSTEASLADDDGAVVIDDAFPYACAPGVFGDSDAPEEQSGPHCSGPCEPGYWCATLFSLSQHPCT